MRKHRITPSSAIQRMPMKFGTVFEVSALIARISLKMARRQSSGAIPCARQCCIIQRRSILAAEGAEKRDRAIGFVKRARIESYSIEANRRSRSLLNAISYIMDKYSGDLLMCTLFQDASFSHTLLPLLEPCHVSAQLMPKDIRVGKAKLTIGRRSQWAAVGMFVQCRSLRRFRDRSRRSQDCWPRYRRLNRRVNFARAPYD